MDDQEERMKNKKYRSLKICQSDIILKFKNIVKFNQNKKLLKWKVNVVFLLRNFADFMQQRNLIIFRRKNEISLLSDEDLKCTTVNRAFYYFLNGGSLKEVESWPPTLIF